eukprot:gene4699-9316_t
MESGQEKRRRMNEKESQGVLSPISSKEISRRSRVSSNVNNTSACSRLFCPPQHYTPNRSSDMVQICSRDFVGSRVDPKTLSGMKSKRRSPRIPPFDVQKKLIIIREGDDLDGIFGYPMDPSDIRYLLGNNDDDGDGDGDDVIKSSNSNNIHCGQRYRSDVIVPVVARLTTENGYRVVRQHQHHHQQHHCGPVEVMTGVGIGVGVESTQHKVSFVNEDETFLTELAREMASKSASISSAVTGIVSDGTICCSKKHRKKQNDKRNRNRDIDVEYVTQTQTHTQIQTETQIRRNISVSDLERMMSVLENENEMALYWNSMHKDNDDNEDNEDEEEKEGMRLLGKCVSDVIASDYALSILDEQRYTQTQTQSLAAAVTPPPHRSAPSTVQTQTQTQTTYTRTALELDSSYSHSHSITAGVSGQRKRRKERVTRTRTKRSVNDDDDDHNQNERKDEKNNIDNNICNTVPIPVIPVSMSASIRLSDDMALEILRPIYLSLPLTLTLTSLDVNVNNGTIPLPSLTVEETRLLLRVYTHWKVKRSRCRVSLLRCWHRHPLSGWSYSDTVPPPTEHQSLTMNAVSTATATKCLQGLRSDLHSALELVDLLAHRESLKGLLALTVSAFPDDEIDTERDRVKTPSVGCIVMTSSSQSTSDVAGTIVIRLQPVPVVDSLI